MLQARCLEYLDAFALSLVVSTTSVTIAKAGIFRTFRRNVACYSTWLGELIHCPYCLSHWIAVGLVLLYHPRLTHGNIPVLDDLVSLFVLVAMATWWSKHLCGSLQAMDGLSVQSDSSPNS